MLDVDQIIEDTAALDRVSGQIDAVAARWGVRVEMVKVQRVEAGPLKAVLEKKKNADLTNKEMIIQAKAKKQTTVIESEGHRDRMIREAEGNAAQTISVGACIEELPCQIMRALPFLDMRSACAIQVPSLDVPFLECE